MFVFLSGIASAYQFAGRKEAILAESFACGRSAEHHLGGTGETDMENSLLIGLSRQVALERNMDVIANNMANMNTAGYKRDQLMFEEYIMPVANMTEGVGRDRVLSYVNTPGMYRDYSPGDMEPTGNELDVAISGKGWLVAQTPDGERYTRNGQLKLDSQGQLVTMEGYPIQGTGGAITFDASETSITIAQDGTISSSAGEKGQLRVVAFDNESDLKKTGENIYQAENGAAPVPATEGRLMQGMVEKSNVNSLMEMTRMIETIRAYTAVSKNLEQAQQLREEAISQLGQTSNT